MAITYHAGRRIQSLESDYTRSVVHSVTSGTTDYSLTSGNRGHANEIYGTSPLIGQTIGSISFEFKGTDTGLIRGLILSGATGGIVADCGTIDSSTVTSSYAWYEFTCSSYTLQTGDRIAFELLGSGTTLKARGTSSSTDAGLRWYIVPSGAYPKNINYQNTNEINVKVSDYKDPKPITTSTTEIYNKSTGASSLDLYTSQPRLGVKAVSGNTKGHINKIKVWLRVIGTHTSSNPVYVRVRKISDDSIVASSTPKTIAELTGITTITEYEFDFGSCVEITASEHYVLVEYPYGDASNYLGLSRHDSAVTGWEWVEYDGSTYDANNSQGLRGSFSSQVGHLCTSIQVGSRLEETDTRKMYHYNQPAFNKTGCVGYYTLDETSGNPTNHAISANGFTTPATETIFTLQHGHDSTGTHYVKKIGSTITAITQAQIDAGYGAVEESHAMGQINTLPSDWTNMLQGNSGSINGHGWWANKYSAVTPTNGSTGATQNVTSKSGLDKCFQFSGADNQEVNLGGTMVTGGLGASGFGDGGGSGDFTFSLWVNTSYTGGGTSMMLTSGTIQFLLDTNVKPKINTSINATLISSDALSANTWYHVVATRQTQVAKIYINGVEKASGTIDHYIRGSTNMVLGGDLSSTSNNFEGKIDEVSIWNRSLSATEITALYNSGTGVTLSNALQSATWSEEGT